MILVFPPLGLPHISKVLSDQLVSFAVASDVFYQLLYVLLIFSARGDKRAGGAVFAISLVISDHAHWAFLCPSVSITVLFPRLLSLATTCLHCFCINAAWPPILSRDLALTWSKSSFSCIGIILFLRAIPLYIYRSCLVCSGYSPQTSFCITAIYSVLVFLGSLVPDGPCQTVDP